MTTDTNERRRRLQALYGRLGGLTAAASGPTRERTSKARAAFNESWIRKVDPNGTLEPAERARRAEAARRQHYVRMVIVREEKRLATTRRRTRTVELSDDTTSAARRQGQPVRGARR
jgi:hypothetical protein